MPIDQDSDSRSIRLIGEEVPEIQDSLRRADSMRFVEVTDSRLRRLFDSALNVLHYAKSCQRVGRCMRLAIIAEEHWVGGVVLGSTFPNVDVRDRYLGLKAFVKGYQLRGLTNPWSRQNRHYWLALQGIVNHARTFVFPDFQGKGIGKEAHRLLLKRGVRMWERKYPTPKVYALDTLCDHSDSGLFVKNDWVHVGETRGFTADYRHKFTEGKRPRFRINNAALKPGKTRWQVWVRVIRPSLKPRPIASPYPSDPS